MPTFSVDVMFIIRAKDEGDAKKKIEEYLKGNSLTMYYNIKQPKMEFNWT